MVKYKLATSKNLNYEKNSTFSLFLKKTQPDLLHLKKKKRIKVKKTKKITNLFSFPLFGFS